jgi:hypothetical protein
MFAGPPAVEPTERARAEVTERAERIYDGAERAAEAEIARLEAAKAWAIAEMDRVTAEAIRRLDAGGDPDVVERWTKEALAAVVERASAPDFDPRPPPTPPRPTSIAPRVATPVAAGTIAAPSPELPPAAPPRVADPEAPTVEVPTVEGPTVEAQGCAVGAESSRGRAPIGWAPWILVALAVRAPPVCTGGRDRRR